MPKKATQQLDLTLGSPLRLLIRFCIPIFIGNIFQQLYNMVDTIIVGRFIGAEALAAVGSCAPVYQIFLGLNSGLALGSGIILSQLIGAKELKRIRNTIYNSLLFLSLIAIIISIISIIAAPQLLRLFMVPENILSDAVIYTRVVLAGCLGLSLYNGMAESLRALGDSQTPLYFLLIASLLNVGLDLLFVAVFHWGIFGAALATIIAQFISAFLCITYATHRFSYYHFAKADRVWSWETVKLIIKTGLPLSLQNAMIGFSGAVLQGFVNSFGAKFVAANTVVTRFDNLQNMPYYSFASALSVFTAQNMGAGRLERVKTSYRITLGLALGYSLFVLAIGWLAGAFFSSWFVADPSIRQTAATGIRTISCGTLALGMIYSHRSILNGSGDTFFSMISGFVEIIGRIGFASFFIFVAKTGYVGIWYAMIANWLLTGFIVFLRYTGGNWQKKGITNSN